MRGNRLMGTLILYVIAASPLPVAGQAAPITITATAPSLHLTSGCGLLVNIAVKNVSAKPVQVWNVIPGNLDRPAEGVVLYQLHATDAAGRPAPISAYARAVPHPFHTSYIIMTLAPKEALKVQAIVTQMFDLSAPGQYKVWFTLKRGPYTGLSSNVLTITVGPPR